MGIFDFIRGNSVDRLNTRELKEEEMRLQNHIELARKDIQKAQDENQGDPILLAALLNKVKAAYDKRG